MQRTKVRCEQSQENDIYKMEVSVKRQKNMNKKQKEIMHLENITFNEKIARVIQKQIWAGRRSNELENSTVEMVKSEEQKGKRKWSKQSLRDLLETISWGSIHIVDVPEGKAREKAKRLFEEIKIKT